MRFGSLFAGIGGFDLGLERAGMECAWQVEIDSYAKRVLEKHWPHVPRWDDVRTFPPVEGQWEVDLICGGFPCQDISFAGKGAGLAGERSGLWYEFARIIGELRPRYVVVENVAALLTRGMGAVLGTLASLGYDAEWHVIPASAVGAPHRRDRVWIVGICVGPGAEADASCADSDRVGPHRTEVNVLGGVELRHEQERLVGSVGGDVPDADGRQVRRIDADAGDGGAIPQQGPKRKLRGSRGSDDVADAFSSRAGHSCGAAQSGGRTPSGRHGSPLRQTHRQACTDRAGTTSEASGDVPDAECDRPQGIIESGAASRSAIGSGCDWWATEPDVGRVAHGVPARVDRLRGLGNAVVPQVVELIGRAIMAREQQA